MPRRRSSSHSSRSPWPPCGGAARGRKVLYPRRPTSWIRRHRRDAADRWRHADRQPVLHRLYGLGYLEGPKTSASTSRPRDPRPAGSRRRLPDRHRLARPAGPLDRRSARGHGEHLLRHRERQHPLRLQLRWGALAPGSRSAAWATPAAARPTATGTPGSPTTAVRRSRSSAPRACRSARSTSPTRAAPARSGSTRATATSTSRPSAAPSTSTATPRAATRPESRSARGARGRSRSTRSPTSSSWPRKARSTSTRPTVR